MNLELVSNNVKTDSKSVKNIIKKLSNPIIYSPLAYGVDNMCTGKNVKVSILDSGCPAHKDIRVLGTGVSFCEKNTRACDTHGHSTMLAGIIGAKSNSAITGFAPQSELYFGKVVNSRNRCDFNSLVTGILWSIVKGVDIIVIALGTQYDYIILRDAIKKARDHGICVFAAAGNNMIDTNWKIEYPARYENAISTGFFTSKKSQNEILRKKVDFNLPNKGLYTTYLDNKYIKVTGSSISAAFYAGLAAVLIEQYKQEKKTDIPTEVYTTLSNIFK